MDFSQRTGDKGLPTLNKQRKKEKMLSSEAESLWRKEKKISRERHFFATSGKFLRKFYAGAKEA